MALPRFRFSASELSIFCFHQRHLLNRTVEHCRTCCAIASHALGTALSFAIRMMCDGDFFCFKFSERMLCILLSSQRISLSSASTWNVVSQSEGFNFNGKCHFRTQSQNQFVSIKIACKSNTCQFSAKWHFLIN